MTDYATDIKSRVSMRDVCRQYEIAVNRGGFAACPFHSEKTASMKIYPGSKGFHCFGCGKGGDVIDFVSELFGLDFPGAIDRLNTDFALGLPIHDTLTEQERAEQDRIARQIAKQRERDRIARQIAQDDYRLALDRYCYYDTLAEQTAPETPFDELSDDYSRAVKEREYAWYLVCEAERRLA